MGGRHRKPRKAGLSPLLSGAGAGAVLAATVWLVQPAGVPDTHMVLPAPTPAVRASAPPPTTTAAPTTTLTTLPPPVVTVKAKPTTTAPTTTTRKAEPSPEPKPEKPADVAPEPPDQPQSSPRCSGLKVNVPVVVACNLIMAAVPGVTVVGGRAARPNNPTSCHPKGLALDLMVYGNKALGDRLAAFVRANKPLLGATTVLWQVADHYDHVHVSFAPCTH